VVSPAMALRFARRTGGELAYLDVMGWVAERLSRPARTPRRPRP